MISTLIDGSIKGLKSNTVELAITKNGDKSCEKLVPTLRVGTPVPDAPRPEGFPGFARALTTRSVGDGIPTRSVGTRKSLAILNLTLIQRYWI